MKATKSFLLYLLLLAPLSYALAAERIGPTFTTVDFPDATNTTLAGVNNEGIVVGQYGTTSGNFGFVYDGSTFRTVEFPGNHVITARDINDLGHITGLYEDISGRRHGYIFDGSNFTTIDFPDAFGTDLLGINNAGAVVGQADSRAFVFDGATFHTIIVPGTTFTIAFDINDLGHIAGMYEDNEGMRHGYVFNGSDFTTIDFPGALGTTLTGINNRGHVTGQFDPPDDPANPDQGLQGFVFDGTTFTPFPELPVTWRINDRGVIVGFYEDAKGTRRGVAGDVLGLQALTKAKPLFVNGIFSSDGKTIATIIDESSGLREFDVRDVNDQGIVAFFAKREQGGKTGIFTTDGDNLTAIVDPDGPFPFRPDGPFDPDLSINNQGSVAFIGKPTPGEEGVFIGDGTTLITIADTTGTYSNFTSVSHNDHGTVVFRTQFGGGVQSGLFTGPDPITDKIIAEGDLLLGNTVHALSFGFFGLGLNNSDQLAIATAFNPAGFRAEPVAIFRSTLVAGGGHIFTKIGDQLPNTRNGGVGLPQPTINDFGVVTYPNGPDSPLGGGFSSILAGDGGPLAVIADVSDGFGSLGGGIINNLGEVAFDAIIEENGERRRLILKGSGDGIFTTLLDKGFNASGRVFAFGNDGIVYFADERFPIPQPLRVAVDVDPKGCPNNLQANARGRLGIVLLGTSLFDVTRVDVGSIRLEGVAPTNVVLGDVGTVRGVLPCNRLGADGFDDLRLQFNIHDVITALGSVRDGDVVPLTLTGLLDDGRQFTGQDVVLIRVHPD